jgi:hypothetical protein
MMIYHTKAYLGPCEASPVWGIHPGMMAFLFGWAVVWPSFFGVRTTNGNDFLMDEIERLMAMTKYYILIPYNHNPDYLLSCGASARASQTPDQILYLCPIQLQSRLFILLSFSVRFCLGLFSLLLLCLSHNVGILQLRPILTKLKTRHT